MKKITCVVVLFFIVIFNNYAFASKRPDWVNNIEKDCFKNEICATGSGTSPSMAKTDARNNILKYFETSISSKFESSLSTDEIEENSFKSEDLEEVSNGILKGVKIRNTYDDGKDFYAFAVLDKNVAAKEIKSDIEKADARMKLLIAEKNVKYNKQLEDLYIKREKLNKRYLVLTDNMIPEVVKYEDIFAAKKKSRELSSIYYVVPSEGYEQQISDYLTNILMENGAKVVNNEKDANRFVVININKTNMHLNVEGFVKQMYTLKIEIKDSSSEVVSGMYQEFVETGRSEAQIKELVNMNIKDYIDENIEQLL